jgi:hypothetical protein
MLRTSNAVLEASPGSAKQCETSMSSKLRLLWRLHGAFPSVPGDQARPFAGRASVVKMHMTRYWGFRDQFSWRRSRGISGFQVLRALLSHGRPVRALQLEALTSRCASALRRDVALCSQRTTSIAACAGRREPVCASTHASSSSRATRLSGRQLNDVAGPSTPRRRCAAYLAAKGQAGSCEIRVCSALPSGMCCTPL